MIRLFALFFVFLASSALVVFAIYFAGMFGPLLNVTVAVRSVAPSLVGAATFPWPLVGVVDVVAAATAAMKVAAATVDIGRSRCCWTVARRRGES